MFKLAPRLAIDFGSCQTRFYVESKGIVKEERTILAVDEDSQVIALGQEAAEMLGKTPGDIRLIQPVIHGHLHDFTFGKVFLSYLIRRLINVNWFSRPEVLVSVPASATSVERSALVEALLASGARVVHLIKQPLAAALGLQIPLAEPQGSLILDIGGGKSEISLISMGNVLAVRSVEWGSGDINQALVGYFLKNYHLIVGQQTIKKLKEKVGSVLPLTLSEKEALKKADKEDLFSLQDSRLEIEVGGRDEFTGLPRRVKINSDDLTEVIQAELSPLYKIITEVMHNIPPELITDVIDKGVVMVGGGSLLKHLSEYLTKKVGIPCYLADNPFQATINGQGQIIESLDYFRSILR